MKRPQGPPAKPAAAGAPGATGAARKSPAAPSGRGAGSGAPKPKRAARAGKRTSALPAERAAAEAKAALKQAKRSRKHAARAERAERRRFTAATRKRRALVLGSLASVALVALASVGVAYSPLMAVRTISVNGTSSLDANAIAASLESELGTPLPLVSESIVRERLQAFPGIQSFSLESIPPGTLLVRIVERVPVGYIAGPAGVQIVDATGVVLGTLADPPGGLAELDVADGLESGAFATLGRVLLQLPPDLRSQVLAASASSASDVRFTLASGTNVVWGDARKAALKLRVLQALLAASPGANEIDVSAPGSPVTR